MLLDHIEDVMSHGGAPLVEVRESGGRFFSRKKVRILAALWFSIFALFLTPIEAILDAEGEMIAVTAVMGAVGALIILIFSFFLPNSTLRTERPVKRTGSIGSSEKAELPPPKTEFADDYVAPAGGKFDEVGPEEVWRPSSVTEGTTRHLDKKRDP
jgi:hypothetical protein